MMDGENMTIKLFFEAIIKYLLGLIIVSLLLFIPAQTLEYWNAWLFIGLLFIPMFIVGIILMFKDPNLLRRRLDVKEKEQEQRLVLLLSGLMFISSFVVAGLNFRFKWIELPNIVVIISSILFIISYILYGEVLRENSYLLRTIKVEKNQKLIDTGLYSIVRHPMYLVTIILFLMIPLVLNSIISFFISLIYPIIIIIRINNEEKVLEKELKEYKEYKKKVKYRLIPYIW
jgi:protein-S-isoprenylcysteine O-methyltransferase Ste14